MKMGMINGLAAAEPIILDEFETGCPERFSLRGCSFLDRDQKVAQLVGLEV